MSRRIFGIINVIAGGLLFIAPLTFLHPCTKKVMLCTYSTRAVVLLSLIIIALSVTRIVINQRNSDIALSLITILTAVEMILIPAKIIGGCHMKTMACQVRTFPGIYIISVLIIVITVISIAVEYIRKSGETS
ncbi:DUF4418 family protein [Anaerosporobacter sp.]